MIKSLSSEPSHGSADILRPSGPTVNAHERAYRQNAYAAAVTGGGSAKEVGLNREVSSTLAAINKPIKNDPRNRHPSNPISAQQDASKSDWRGSTNDGNPRSSEDSRSDPATKPESTGVDKRGEKPLHGEKTPVMLSKPRAQGSENDTHQHQLVISQRNLGTNETERRQKKPDNTVDRNRYNPNFEKERRDIMKRMGDAEAGLKEAQRRNRDLEERNKHLTNQVTALSTQLQGAEAQHQQTLQLLEAQRSELKGARAFLTKEDTLSGADVIAMVDVLNAEILQTAAFMADSLNGTGRDVNALAEEAKWAHDRAIRIVGDHMVHILKSRLFQPKSDDDSMELQIALQVCLVYSCISIVESWWPGYWREGDMLSALYSQIIEKEGQSVSGRWRAITRSYVKHLGNPHSRVVAYVTGDVGSILTVAGWSQRILEEKGFLEIFQEKLTIIGTLALRLQTTIGETIISGDLKTAWIPTNVGFDPNTMEDGFSQNGGSTKTITRQRVAGTTDIGLHRLMKESSVHILRKPKVVLYSALE